ncbi:hypothetical protein HMPREF0765_1163 [Sphingobacterium spiritivorum ATCC 33300]|uniref:Uncharacterized protein n=1 Tax=Sphingobacterium spiritivorum ATCC 33300 TaxID=525372 RepID=C2FV07_SPHSI|nr:hypothetical protein [Sphingobacterium spiritivorum]EEI93251.1 hypothetical protein HMPREF0765_1163 [Sphingobacterium spiritivorum ATCC 33300]QQS96046.1 hypothetical protein I6J03_22200 [Sphingobacterium spiritivorum]
MAKDVIIVPIFPVDPNVRISITSTTNAKFNQRFWIEKRYKNSLKGEWIQMGNHVYYGAQASAIEFKIDTKNEESWWRIRGENDTGDGGWKSSRGIESLGVGTEEILIKFDDDFTGDSDFDDLVVKISLIYPDIKKLDEKFYNDFDKRASGPNGKKYFDSKKVIPELDKKGKPIKPH